MSNNYLFHPKSNGTVSFRQQTIKMNDENAKKESHLGNFNKSVVLNQEESQREFGKDITNLTNYNQENINPNARKSIDAVTKENKIITVNLIVNFLELFSKESRG